MTFDQIPDGPYWYRSQYTNGHTKIVNWNGWEMVRLGTDPSGKRVLVGLHWREPVSRLEKLATVFEVIRIAPPLEERPPHPLDLAYWTIESNPQFESAEFAKDTAAYVTRINPFEKVNP